MTGRHRRPRRHRLPGRRQDGHDRQEHRRLVRRFHAAAVDRGLGRLPRRRPALDERHVRPDRRQHRRRHLPRRHLGHLHEEGRGLLLRRLQAPDRAVHSQPFQGHYARQGGKDEDEKRRRPERHAGPGARHRDRAGERQARTTAATPTAAGTTATTAATATATAATTARPSTRTSTRPRRRARPTRSPAAAPKHRPGTGSGSHSGLVQLAPSGPSTGGGESGGSVREGSAPAAVLAHAGSRGVAV